MIAIVLRENTHQITTGASDTSFSLKSAIVTGATGFVGSAVTHILAEEGVLVYALDLQHSNEIKHPHIQNISCDIVSIEQIRSNIIEPPDVFFAFAWRGSAGEARKDYAIQLENARQMADCVVFAKSIGCTRFVGAGSITERETNEAVYAQGSKPGMPYIYGAGKVAAHEICKCVAAKEEIDFLWAFITNAYGPGELSPRLVNTTLRKMMNDEDVSFTAGTQRYDFVYIDDVARAFYLIAKYGKPFHEYNIGSGTSKPLKEYMQIVRDIAAPGKEIRFGDIPFTGIDLAPEAFDITQLREDTGFNPEVDFAEGVLRTKIWLEGIL